MDAPEPAFQLRERVFNIEQEEVDLLDLLLARRYAGGRVDKRFRQDPSVRVDRRVHAHQMAERGHRINRFGIVERDALLDPWTHHHERHRPRLRDVRGMSARRLLAVVAGDEHHRLLPLAALFQRVDELAQVPRPAAAAP